MSATLSSLRHHAVVLIDSRHRIRGALGDLEHFFTSEDLESCETPVFQICRTGLRSKLRSLLQGLGEEGTQEATESEARVSWKGHYDPCLIMARKVEVTGGQEEFAVLTFETQEQNGAGSKQSGEAAEERDYTAEELEQKLTEAEVNGALAELRLKLVEDVLGSLYEDCHHMHVTSDAETGVILHCNRTLAEKLGYEKEELIGTSIFDLYEMDSVAEAQKAMADHLRKGQSSFFPIALQLGAKDGSFVDVSLKLTGIRGFSGKIVSLRSSWVDITQQTRAEEQLEIIKAKLASREEEGGNEVELSEQKFRTLCQRAPVGIFWTDSRGHCLYVNECWSNIPHLSPEKAKGESWARGVHPEDLEWVVQKWRFIAKGGRSFHDRFRFVRPNGEVRWVEEFADPTYDSQGNITGYIGTTTDITDQVEASERLSRSHDELESLADRLKLACECADLGVWDWSVNEDKIFWDQRMHEIYGVDYPQEKVVYQTWRDTLVQEDVDRAERLLRHSVETGEDFVTNFRIRHPNGEVRHIMAHAVVKRSPFDGTAEKVVGFNRDITNLKVLEQDALEGAERERNRLGADLHDGLCQELGGLAFSCGATELRLRQLGLDKEAEKVAQIAEKMSEVSVKARNLARGLSPLTMGKRNLGVALESLIHSAKQSYDGIDFDLHMDLEATKFQGARPTQLFLIASEALANAIRHGNPTKVEICLKYEDQQFFLEVSDNGSGSMASIPENEEGFGIRSMRSRAWSTGGVLEIRDNPEGKGIQVRCIIDIE